MRWTLVFGIILIAILSTPALSASWEEAIVNNEKRSKELADRARKLVGHLPSLGTGVNELDVNEHSCAILGRMLNRSDLIRHLEEPLPDSYLEEVKDPHSSEEIAEAYAYASLSLTNWLVNAKRLLKASKAERIREWNLDCVGKLRIPTTSYIGEGTKATFFTVENDGLVLRVLGDVEAGFARKLTDALDRNPRVKHVALGSGGGYVKEALIAAVAIRSRKLTTVLWNNCYSACTLVFLGGMKRHIWSPYPNLSFHQVSVEGKALPPSHPIYETISKFAYGMGANGDVFVRLMLSSPPNKFTDANLYRACAANIATWVQRVCSGGDKF